MSVIVETSHDPIGPCGPLEQSVAESSRHFTTAALNSFVDFGTKRYTGVVGTQPVVCCDSGYTFGVTLRITIKLRISYRARVIKGELAPGSRLTLGANGGCTRGQVGNLAYIYIYIYIWSMVWGK